MLQPLTLNLNPKPQTLNPIPQNLNPERLIPNPNLQTLNHIPQTPSPKPKPPYSKLDPRIRNKPSIPDRNSPKPACIHQRYRDSSLCAWARRLKMLEKVGLCKVLQGESRPLQMPAMLIQKGGPADDRPLRGDSAAVMSSASLLSLQVQEGSRALG